MNVPDGVQRHPNATFALSSTPFAVLLGWVFLQFGVTMPQYVATAAGTLLVGFLLIFRTALTRAAEAVWTFGIYGCCRRVWKGPPPA